MNANNCTNPSPCDEVKTLSNSYVHLNKFMEQNFNRIEEGQADQARKIDKLFQRIEENHRESLDKIEKKVDENRVWSDAVFVRKIEFSPVQRAVYAVAGIVGATVVVAILSMIITN